jgi:hypothetical protein
MKEPMKSEVEQLNHGLAVVCFFCFDEQPSRG